jgi:hypothetical protein
VVVRAVDGSGDQRRTDASEPVECGGEVAGPGPAAVDSDLGSALPPDETGGDMQQPVAQRLRLGLGQLTGQQGRLGPGDQVGGGERQLQLGLVDLELAGREAADPGLLNVSDLVLDSGVGAVPGLQPGQLPGRGVGGQSLIAPAIMGFEHADLRARVRAFASHQDPHAGRPARLDGVGEQSGELGDLGARQTGRVGRSWCSSASTATVQAVSGSRRIASATVLVTLNPTENDTSSTRTSRRLRR